MEKKEAKRPRDIEYIRLGGTALRGAEIGFSELGVNDYATHLRHYLEYGDSALDDIEEDLITDSGERLVNAWYVNRVDFVQNGNDFLSRKGNFSMRRMAANTLDRMKDNRADRKLQMRAEIEALEPLEVAEWFRHAGHQETLEVDSLPMAGNEVYAVKRIYTKTGTGNLAMHVVILHNPSLQVFNEYRGANGLPLANNELGILKNTYSRRLADGQTVKDFIQKDVDKYDAILSKHNAGQEYLFGLRADEARQIPNGNDMVRRQKPLLNIYKETIKALGSSDWAITADIINISRKLGLNLDFNLGQKLTLDDSRAMLDGVHQYIMSTLNNAPKDTLDMLAALHDQDKSAAYGVAGQYGSEAAAAGVRYESSACPTVTNINSNTEQAIAERAYRLNKDPTKCVMCPGCKNIVDLPKDLYKEGILHCVECKLTVKNGKVFDYSKLAKSENESNVRDGFDIIAESVRRYGLEGKIRRMAKVHAKEEFGEAATYADEKRIEMEMRARML